jgi:hypothetical protein
MTNTPSYNHYKIQLKDALTKQSIITTGGACHVAIAGSPDKETLTDKNGVALANPLQLTAGMIDFCVASTKLTVDLYIMAPGGQFIVLTGIGPSGLNEYEVDTAKKTQLAVIPFSVANQAGDATETDTGFNLPSPAVAMPSLGGMGLQVTTADSGITIEVGTLSTESGGDANGLCTATSVGTLGLVHGANGALFGSDTDYLTDAHAAVSVSYTLLTAADTAKGFFRLPYHLA